HDGDTLHFGHGLSSASVLFQVMPENFSTAGLARRGDSGSIEGAPQPVHPLTATLFVKELTASLWAEIPRRAKMIAVATGAAAAILIAGVLFVVLFSLLKIAHKTNRLGEQITTVQTRRDQDQEIIKKQQEEIERLREMGEQTRRFTQKISEL